MRNVSGFPKVPPVETLSPNCSARGHSKFVDTMSVARPVPAGEAESSFLSPPKKESPKGRSPGSPLVPRSLKRAFASKPLSSPASSRTTFAISTTIKPEEGRIKSSLVLESERFPHATPTAWFAALSESRATAPSITTITRKQLHRPNFISPKNSLKGAANFVVPRNLFLLFRTPKGEGERRFFNLPNLLHHSAFKRSNYCFFHPRKHLCSTSTRRKTPQDYPFLIVSKKSLFVDDCFNLSIIRFSAPDSSTFRMRRRSNHSRARESSSKRSSSRLVPDLVMSMAGKILCSESFLER